MAMAERICSGVSVRKPRYAGSSIAYRSCAPGAVGLAHERGPEQNPAIDEDLERTDLQPVIAAAEPERQAGDEPFDLGRVLGVRDAERHGRTHVQPAGALQRLVGPIPLDRRVPFDHARDAGLDVLLVHALEHVQRRHRRCAGPEAREHRPDVAQETRRLAAGVLGDRPSWGIRRRAGHASGL